MSYDCPVTTDVELIRTEVATLWLRDARERLLRDGRTRRHRRRAAPHLVIATAADGQVVAIGSEVPDALANELRAAAADDSGCVDVAARPSTLDQCARLLEGAVGPVELSSGPSYLIPSATLFAPQGGIRRSDGGSEDLRPMNPVAANWSVGEWDSLLDGALGPWAMATNDDRVVSICHSARLTDSGAEAGVWTDAEYRGRGYAAAVTAAWASLLTPSGRCLFYSTSATNLSSQQVAARLNLRLIGWTWRLSSPSSV
jgi:GNAT acetyltransferase